ncbi:MAG: YgfZ/GcvT domain-containing protein, partial [Solirubrobacterales bacterium]
ADAGAAREALAQSGAVGVSEAAAEIVRVEAGRPRFGAEMTDATIPAEAGINERAVSFSKGCYIGQETVARLHYKGKPNRHLRGLRLDGQVSPGEPIRLGEREVGTVGSACLSPALGPIALAIVRREAAPGEHVAIGDGGVGAEVVELPFA